MGKTQPPGSEINVHSRQMVVLHSVSVHNVPHILVPIDLHWERYVCKSVYVLGSKMSNVLKSESQVLIPLSQDWTRCHLFESFGCSFRAADVDAVLLGNLEILKNYKVGLCDYGKNPNHDYFGQ